MTLQHRCVYCGGWGREVVEGGTEPSAREGGENWGKRANGRKVDKELVVEGGGCGPEDGGRVEFAVAVERGEKTGRADGKGAGLPAVPPPGP